MAELLCSGIVMDPFGTRGHRFGTRRQIFETKFNYRTEGAVQRQSIVFYENRSGKSLKYDIISEHRDIISEQTTNFLKLTVLFKKEINGKTAQLFTIISNLPRTFYFNFKIAQGFVKISKLPRTF